MSVWIAYLLTGVLAGVLAGMLGIGGGLVVVPALLLLFAQAGFAPEYLTQMAIGSSLATIVFTSLSAVWAHQRRKAVRWQLVKNMTAGLLPGAAGGAMLATAIPGDNLKSLFAGFLLIVCWRMLFAADKHVKKPLPGSYIQAVMGLLMGTLSSILGIGGGTMSVPVLLHFSVNMRESVATASACGFPIALAGALGFIGFGWNISTLPAGSAGYVYLPAVVLISISSVAFAPVGAYLAHHLPVAILKRVFALTLLPVAARLADIF